MMAKIYNKPDVMDVNELDLAASLLIASYVHLEQPLY